MYAIFDIDSSYFDLSVGSDNITQNVIELSIIEEVHQLLHGNLIINDPIWAYAKLLRAGTSFNLTWGYKNRNQSISDMTIKKKNPEEVSNLSVREGTKGIVTQPRFIFGASGEKTFSCGFFGPEYGDSYREAKTYTSGTKKQLIEDEMKAMGIKSSDIYIKFDAEKDKLSDKSVTKNERTYKFLVKLAKEWMCDFILTRSSKGDLKGSFINRVDIGSKNFNEKIAGYIGATGSRKLFEYGIGSTYPNVIDGEITHNVGESGQGDSERCNIVGDKVVVTRYTAETGKTQTLKLDESKVNDFAESNEGNSGEIVNNAVETPSMDAKFWHEKKAKDFFTAETVDTAPQGAGFSGTLNVIGDPSLCVPIEAMFGYGFPPQLQEQKDINNRIFLRKIEHNLSRKGYLCKVDFADALTTYSSYTSE